MQSEESSPQAPRRPQELREIVSAELGREPSAAACSLAAEIVRRHGSAVSSVLYYGSGLRAGEQGDVVLDLLVVVDSYREVYSRLWLALANALLAPNVFYLEVEHEGRTVRAKYALLSRGLLERGTSPSTLQVYYWGRFSQPCLLVHARDEAAREQVLDAFSQAVATFVRRALPLAPEVCEADKLWELGLAACYRTELRAERANNVERLMRVFDERASAVTRAVVEEGRLGSSCGRVSVEGEGARTRFRCELSSAGRARSRRVWLLRRVQGKSLHLMRLIKGVFTFEGGVDYILWKIERHSGVHVDPSPRVRRHPLIFGWGTLWKLYRLGAFR